MAPIILMLIGTLCQEGQQSLGKTGVLRHIESPYAMGFLGMVWSAVFFGVLAFCGADFRFTINSLPTFAVRLVLEITLARVMIAAINEAQISVVEFVRTLTVPLLLIVDLALGYSIKSNDILGVCLIMTALIIIFFHNPAGKKGAHLALFSALLAVGTTSLFKYDITHYNSVTAEQLVMLILLTTYFYLLAVFKGHEHPMAMLHQKLTGPQSLLNGVAIVTLSFAISIAPPSIVISLKRVFTIFWSIILGKTYFHEGNTARRALAFSLVGAGVVLIAL